ncbi:DUF433 domain-containing protein [Candidatus Chloroploca sp. Khr17]|uniref:DUF433 domain-containing protein n=1 Tax=Candidatus Chloroploca sp. Khr17 TaxID=2496869 RepID=UPI003519D5B2
MILRNKYRINRATGSHFLPLRRGSSRRVIRGLRLTVYDVLLYLAAGMSISNDSLRPT